MSENRGAPGLLFREVNKPTFFLSGLTAHSSERYIFRLGTSFRLNLSSNQMPEKSVSRYEFALRREAILLCDNFRSGCRRVQCLPGSSPLVEHPRFPSKWHALAF